MSNVAPVAVNTLSRSIDFLVLHTLATQGPLSGYAIAVEIDRLLGSHDAVIDLPAVYPSAGSHVSDQPTTLRELCGGAICQSVLRAVQPGDW
jgi:hypothetical protein